MFLIYDLECSFSVARDTPRNYSELLEIGAVLVDGGHQVVDSFQSYVKPVFHTQLTHECIELLGDIQSSVDKAQKLPVVWAKFEEWLSKYPIAKVASWGISDKTFLCAQLERYKLQSEFLEIEYVDLKKAFRKSRPLKIKPVGLKRACEILEIKMVGSHHSALDDAMSVFKVSKKLNLLGGLL